MKEEAETETETEKRNDGKKTHRNRIKCDRPLAQHCTNDNSRRQYKTLGIHTFHPHFACQKRSIRARIVLLCVYDIFKHAHKYAYRCTAAHTRSRTHSHGNKRQDIKS